MFSPVSARRLTLAPRLACDLPIWAVARASNMSDEALEEIMVERGFAELVSSMAELMAMDEQARLKKLYRIAEETIAAAILRRDERATEFMLRQMKLGRNPHQILNRGRTHHQGRDGQGGEGPGRDRCRDAGTGHTAARAPGALRLHQAAGNPGRGDRGLRGRGRPAPPTAMSTISTPASTAPPASCAARCCARRCFITP